MFSVLYHSWKVETSKLFSFAPVSWMYERPRRTKRKGKLSLTYLSWLFNM